MPRAVRTISVEEQVVGYFRSAHLQTAIAILNIARAEVQARMPKPASPSPVARAEAAVSAAPKKRVRRTKAEMAAAKNLQSVFGGNSRAHEAEDQGQD